MHSVVAILALAGSVLAQTASTGTISSSIARYSPYPTGTVTTTVTTTIYCPGPTTFICGGTTYSPTAATTVTVTCKGGCNITPVPQPAGSMTPPAPAPPPASYTGAADKVQVGGALIAAAIGLAVL